MDFFSFALNLAVALLLGSAIGIERQFRQHPAGLRTNALVSLGAALFVCLAPLLVPGADQTRIAAQVVSGIGFLGGGVILREGMTVKGMNTAATLWCSAAVGTLAGMGFPWHAAVGATAVLAIHIGLRPLAREVEVRMRKAEDVETLYRIHVDVTEHQEAVIRNILLRHINTLPRMRVQGIATHQGAGHGGCTKVDADVYSAERNDAEIQQLLSRLNVEPSVTAVSWDSESVPTT